MIVSSNFQDVSFFTFEPAALEQDHDSVKQVFLVIEEDDQIRIRVEDPKKIEIFEPK